MSRFFPFLLIVALVSAAAAGEKQKVRLTVKGMTCNGCVRTIRNGVKNLDGIEKVNVRLQDKMVEVEFDSSRISPQNIQEEIKKMGYKPTLLKADDPDKIEGTKRTGNTEKPNPH